MLDDFASFMRQVAARYSPSEFNVHDWEIGNEPDIDADFVGLNNGFGCWGDTKDPYYGGRQYGLMLQFVTPAIRAVDPKAVIWLEGCCWLIRILPIPIWENPNYSWRGFWWAAAAPILTW